MKEQLQELEIIQDELRKCLRKSGKTQATVLYEMAVNSGFRGTNEHTDTAQKVASHAQYFRRQLGLDGAQKDTLHWSILVNCMDDDLKAPVLNAIMNHFGAYAVLHSSAEGCLLEAVKQSNTETSEAINALMEFQSNPNEQKLHKVIKEWTERLAAGKRVLQILMRQVPSLKEVVTEKKDRRSGIGRR